MIAAFDVFLLSGIIIPSLNTITKSLLIYINIITYKRNYLNEKSIKYIHLLDVFLK